MSWRELDRLDPREATRRRAGLQARLTADAIVAASTVVSRRWLEQPAHELLEARAFGRDEAEVLLAAALYLDAVPVDAESGERLERPRRRRRRALPRSPRAPFAAAAIDRDETPPPLPAGARPLPAEALRTLRLLGSDHEPALVQLDLADAADGAAEGQRGGPDLPGEVPEAELEAPIPLGPLPDDELVELMRGDA